MPFSNFTQFSAALCETAGAAVPQLNADAGGLVAFHLVLQDVVVNVAHVLSLQGDNDEAFLLVTFGTIPEEKELEVLRLLTDTNFSMLSGTAPVFGRNPATGEVVLRQLLHLSQIDAPGAFDVIVRLAALARLWRVDPTLAAQEDGNSFGFHQFA